MARNPSYDAALDFARDFLAHEAAASFGGVWPNAKGETFYEGLNRLTIAMRKLYEEKDTDYASDGRPMGNLRASEFIGIQPWKAVLLRLSDKAHRIKSFITKGSFEVDDEKIEDTLRDMGNYALLGLLLFREWADIQANVIRSDNPLHRASSAKKLAALSQADLLFMDMAIAAIRCALLAEQSGSNWSDEPWEHTHGLFTELALFSRENPI